MLNKPALILASAFIALCLAGCGNSQSADKDDLASKLDNLSKTFAEFEKVVESAATIEDAKKAPQYAAMTKAQDEVNKAKATAQMTDDQKRKLESLEKRINLVVNQ